MNTVPTINCVRCAISQEVENHKSNCASEYGRHNSDYRPNQLANINFGRWNARNSMRRKENQKHRRTYKCRLSQPARKYRKVFAKRIFKARYRWTVYRFKCFGSVGED